MKILAETPQTHLTHDVPEASAMTGLGDRTIRRKIAAGEIRAVKVGTRVLIPHDALVEFLASRPAVVESR
jgi:excisionase family DNA binding protein